MSKNSILVVEDEVKMQRILEVNLRDKYNVLLASNGQEALDIVRRKGVNIILTDMKMPGKDGLSLLHDVKAFAPDIPVILITAYGTIESAVKATNADLSMHQRIAAWRLWPERDVPRTHTLKIRRNLVREWAGGKVALQVHEAEDEGSA